MSDFAPATHKGIKPLIGFFGESGGGKTFSALLVGRGIAGPNGKLGIIDTENGRGSLYCDLIPGGYLALDLQPPFSPEAYVAALDKAEKAGIDVIVVDSTTHEWIGEGGYLSMKEEALDRMAGNDWRKRESCKFAASAQCKPKHNAFVHRLLRSRMAVILCFRAKQKVKMEKDDSGKTKVQADENVSPISDSGLIFEMLIAGEVYADEKGMGGFFRCTKHTHPDLLKTLPASGKQVGIETGHRIAQWATGGGKFAGTPASAPTTAATDGANTAGASDDAERGRIKGRIWNFARTKFNDNIDEFKQFLWDEGIISDTEELGSIPSARLNEVFAALQTHKKFAQ